LQVSCTPAGASGAGDGPGLDQERSFIVGSPITLFDR
jgi:hypothetical protein